jgi:uncharacterized protein
VAGSRDRPPLWLWSLWRLLLFVILFGVLTLALGMALPAGAFGEGETGGVLLYTFVMLAAACTAGWVLLRACDERPAAALGFGWVRRTPAELGIGFAIGAGALAVAAAAMFAIGALRYSPDAGTFGTWGLVLARDLAVLGVAAAAEEALFRGYPFQVLVQWSGAVPATLLLSAAFALAHIGNPNVGGLALLNIFLAGVVLSVAYLRTLSLWFATAVHLGWNWAMASLFDMPVSGITMFDTPLYDAHVGGPAWLTGMEFGPEGGVLGTLAFAAAGIALLRIRAVRPDERNLAARPLVMATHEGE